MRREKTDWIHDALDARRSSGADPAGEARLQEYRESLESLRRSREPAPPGLAAQIRSRLPHRPGHAWWAHSPWSTPALAGGLAVVAIVIGLAVWFHGRGAMSGAPGLVKVHFELHAPGARRVELLGDFNYWRPGRLPLEGPDASGHWTTTVELPEGRYEYLFLVDGQEWVTDPSALVVRPDGFGRMNAVREVSGEGTIL